MVLHSSLPSFQLEVAPEHSASQRGMLRRSVCSAIYLKSEIQAVCCDARRSARGAFGGGSPSPMSLHIKPEPQVPVPCGPQTLPNASLPLLHPVLSLLPPPSLTSSSTYVSVCSGPVSLRAGRPFLILLQILYFIPRALVSRHVYLIHTFFLAVNSFSSLPPQLHLAGFHTIVIS